MEYRLHLKIVYIAINSYEKLHQCYIIVFVVLMYSLKIGCYQINRTDYVIIQNISFDLYLHGIQINTEYKIQSDKTIQINSYNKYTILHSHKSVIA